MLFFPPDPKSIRQILRWKHDCWVSCSACKCEEALILIQQIPRCWNQSSCIFQGTVCTHHERLHSCTPTQMLLFTQTRTQVRHERIFQQPGHKPIFLNTINTFARTSHARLSKFKPPAGRFDFWSCPILQKYETQGGCRSSALFHLWDTASFAGPKTPQLYWW